MQIVIEILEEIYTHLLARYKYQNIDDIGLSELDKVGVSIKNGKPLPKGHGRLIDADDIALIDEQFYVPSDYYVAESAINDAPTIIEADKEE